MINGAREFALRWLLEPTKKLEEVQYEYVFRLVDYHSQELIVTFRDETSIGRKDPNFPGNDDYYIIKGSYSADFPIIQAKLFKKTLKRREYLGIIEYLGFDYLTENSRYMNANTSEDISTKKYIYYLTSNAIGLPCYSTFRGRNSTMQRYHSITGDLTYSAKLTEAYTENIFTSNYYNFSENAYFNLSGGQITIYGMSYSGYEYEGKTIYIYPEQPEYRWTSTYDAVENASFSFYTSYSGFNNNFYNYQDYLFKPRDSLLSITPQFLVKCSDGLDFDTYNSIAQETQYFNKNTTITFEHD